MPTPLVRSGKPQWAIPMLVGESAQQQNTLIHNLTFAEPEHSACRQNGHFDFGQASGSLVSLLSLFQDITQLALQVSMQEIKMCLATARTAQNEVLILILWLIPDAVTLDHQSTALIKTCTVMDRPQGMFCVRETTWPWQDRCK